MKKQKFIIVLLLLGFISSAFESPMRVFANDVELVENDEIQPRYTNLQMLQVAFGVEEMDELDEFGNHKGDAIATVITTFYDNTDYIVVFIDFERRDPSGWVNLATCFGRMDDSPAAWGTSITVKHGYYYRAVVTVELYDEDGNLAETVTLPSNADYF